MSTLKWSLLAGVLSALVTAGAFYLHFGHERKAMADLHAANQTLRTEILARSDARKQAVTPVMDHSLHATAERAAHAARPGAISTDYRDAGRATPVATLQTFAWACDRGDTAKVAELLTFEGGGRAKVSALMEKLPANLRSQWTTPEELAASICISGYMRWPYPSAEIIALADTESVGPDRTKIRLPGTSLDGGNYVKTESGWKFVIPEAGIDDYIAKNSGKTTSAP